MVDTKLGKLEETMKSTRKEMFRSAIDTVSMREDIESVPTDIQHLSEIV